MHDVVCTHCGRFVQITPDAPRCTQCGEDLHPLIPEHYAARYFYRRAADLAARSDLPSALAEAERGLNYLEASELRLLAAILAKRLGDIDTVRDHVAAIPVDDRLRQEAEWLIRAQPGRRAPDEEVPTGARRSGKKRTAAAPQPPLPLADTLYTGSAQPSPVIEIVPAAEVNPPATAPLPAKSNVPLPTPILVSQPPPSRPAVWSQRLWAMVAFVMLITAGAMGWLLISGGPDALLSLIPGLAPESSELVQDSGIAPVTPAPLVLPTSTPQGQLQVIQPTVPPDLVLSATPQPLAGLGSAVGAAAGGDNLDLVVVLQQAGRADLARLGLNAELQANTVRVSGVVTNTADRLAVIDIANAVPGVDEVSALQLLVRLPATYTVQEGDSLWQIVTTFYGPESTRVAELYEANRDVLPSAQALQVGMTLKLPPLD